MKEYEFKLLFALPDAMTPPDRYVESLGATGCTDALPGIGKAGRIALDFAREAESAREAIESAISDVRRAIPGARLIEAGPDYVGLTEIAEILGFTRQNMRKLMLNSAIEFPDPVHEGKPSIWHLEPVLLWLRDRKGYEIDDILLETARMNFQVNLAKLTTDRYST